MSPSSRLSLILSLSTLATLLLVPAAAGDSRLIPPIALTVGGDQYIGEYDLAVADNGFLFLAAEAYTPYESILIRRSTDGGLNWHDWGAVESFEHETDYHAPTIHVPPGQLEKVFLSYGLRSTATGLDWSGVYVASATLLSETPDWSHTTVDAALDFRRGRPRLTSDAVHDDDYNLYLAFAFYDDFVNSIHFTRSSDQGATWSEPYALGPVLPPSYMDMTVGQAGSVHLAFDNSIEGFGITYMRAGNHAASQEDWSDSILLTVDTNEKPHGMPSVAASTTSPQVTVTLAEKLGAIETQIVVTSSDGGATWSSKEESPSFEVYGGEIVLSPYGYGLCGYDGLALPLQTRESIDPLGSWEMKQMLPTGTMVPPRQRQPAQIISDPSHGNRYGVAGFTNWVPFSVLHFWGEWMLDTTGLDEPELALEPVWSVHPNPARGTVTIDPRRVEEADVDIWVTDAGGRVIRSFLEQPTSYATIWDLRDDQGREVPAGIYFLRMQLDGGLPELEKVTVIR